MNTLRIANRLKHNTLALAKYPGAQPHWVADMSFATPEPILLAINKRVMERHFSYPNITDTVYRSIQHWCNTRYDWTINRDWIVVIPNTMSGVRTGVKSVHNSAVIYTQHPNYHKLLDIGKSFDVDIRSVDTSASRKPFSTHDLQSIALVNPSAVVLCNPTNPTGTVSSRAELETLADCIRDLRTIVISDEAHADFILSDQLHVPAGSVKGLENKSITILSPSKTFNLAGISVAFAVIPSEQIRNNFISTLAFYSSGINALGLIALEQAYDHCSAWLDTLLQQLRHNQRYLYDCLLNTSFKYTPSDATYLAWIDTRAAGSDVFNRLLNKGIAVSNGTDFGSPGWIRFNFAHPKNHLTHATNIILDLFGNKK